MIVWKLYQRNTNSTKLSAVLARFYYFTKEIVRVIGMK